MRYTFSDCVLDTDSHKLFRAGENVSVEPQVFDLLHLLVQNAGNLVTRDQLIDTVWGGRIVSEATISGRINAARNAVGDNGKDQAVIRTVPRRGFELAVTAHTDDETPVSKPTALPDSRQTIRFTTSADGTGIAFAKSGTGPPLLRAGHHVTHLELDWNSPFWRPHFDELGKDHTLIRYDIRGTGLSGSNLIGTDIDHHVADLAAVADAADLERFPLLASLQSTPVAIRYATQHPERVSKLIIHNGYARGRAVRNTESGDQEADPMISLLRGGGWGNPASGFMRAWISLVAPSLSYDETTALIELIAGACPTENVIENRKIIDRFDSTELLSQIRVPTLVIHARSGSVHPLSEGSKLAAAIAGAEFLVVESSNTLCLPSDPTWRQQTDAILEFLDRPDP